uniref:RNA-directed RNA polymerase n=1 Tax=Leviviridae sp. TaxID=2027243 RepID=A0A514D815_9VIRU|nr:MAG: RNA-dependent RNA polymerase [Leviviridae sp.]
MSPSLNHVYMNYLDGLLKPQFVMSDPELLNSSCLDYAYSLKRFSEEGVSFLTVSLPKLRKAVDLSFKTGLLEVPNGFALMKGTKLPQFLFSHMKYIYELDGSLRFMPFTPCIAHVRQVTEAFYKLEIPYSPALEAATIENFVNNEILVESFVDSYNNRPRTDFPIVSGAAMLARYVFHNFDVKDIRPRHGSGSLATGEVGEEKWEAPFRFYKAIESVYPYSEYFYHSPGMLSDLGDRYISLPNPTHGVSKVMTVPKDSRGPRIITEEPCEYMYFQQGLGRKMMSWLESKPLTKGHINFTDQTVNQRLALEGSRDGYWATLDLKDASDRLSKMVVSEIFRLKPAVLEALLSIRTPVTQLPSKRELSLAKFAGMGSATCFPTESFCFWALSVTAIALASNMGLYMASDLVYVYGDDIIIPSDYAKVVIDGLESVGLLVNKDKSYYEGDFRESCGVDAFLGTNITATRFKKLFPVDSDDGEAYAAWVAYANAFAAKGYEQLAYTIFQDLEKLFGRIPYGVAHSPFPCRIVDDPADAEVRNKRIKVRWRVSRDYQRLEFKVKTLVPVTRPSQLDSWARFSRNILSGTGDEPSLHTIRKELQLLSIWSAV